MYLTNAFSLNMLRNANRPFNIRVVPLNLVEAAQELAQTDFVSAVGHEDTARILSDMLGVKVPCQRITVLLSPGDSLIVAQYIGPRLPEGAAKLPEGAEIKFFYVEIGF